MIGAYITDRIEAVNDNTSRETLLSLLSEARAVIVGRDASLRSRQQARKP